MPDSKSEYLNLFLIFSPFRILIILIILELLRVAFSFGSAGGWEMLAFIYGVPILIIFILLDYVIKMLAKNDIASIWIVQLLIIAITAGLWFL